MPRLTELNISGLEALRFKNHVVNTVNCLDLYFKFFKFQIPGWNNWISSFQADKKCIQTEIYIEVAHCSMFRSPDKWQMKVHAVFRQGRNRMTR